jgi:hypothetical protein
MKDEKPYWVIGIIDCYGAIHHQSIYLNDPKMHDSQWPFQTHKRWRFGLSDWNLETSPFSEKLTETEAEDILALIRKHYTPPLWVIEGEEWDALGRPRSGKAYDKHRRKWDKIYKRKNRT